jgi:hypothetical protein
MTGIACSIASALRRRVASKPSRIGSWMSMRMRSGQCAAAAAFITNIAESNFRYTADLEFTPTEELPHPTNLKKSCCSLQIAEA